MSPASEKPFEVMRWESKEEPTREFLMRMMNRECHRIEEEEVPLGKTQEMKFKEAILRVPLSGAISFGFPGYGSVDLEPGDILEIQPNILHDITISGHQPALILRGYLK